MNPLDYLKSQISESLIDHWSREVSENRESVTKSVDLILPSLLSGMAGQCTDREHLNRLWDFLGLEEELQKNQLGAFSSWILNHHEGLLEQEVYNTAGLRGTNSNVLLIQKVFDWICKNLKQKIQEDALGSDQFATWMAKGKASAIAQIPIKLHHIFGAADQELASKDQQSGWMGIAGLLGFLALLFGLFNGIKSCQQKEIPAAKAFQEEEKDPYATLDSTTRLRWARLGLQMKYLVPGGAEISIPDKGVELRLLSYLDDTSKHGGEMEWFDFDRILFETGSDSLNPASMDQLNTMNTILRAYYRIEVKIGGYTDNVGDSTMNVQLSQRRAETVREELIKLGIDSNRMTAEGYGPLHPVGDNATEEGRYQNRRVALRVLKK